MSTTTAPSPPPDAAPPRAAGDADVVLDVRGLRTCFDVEGGTVRAVDGVSLRARSGRTLAIVGESGCGKSVTAYSIMRLIQPPGRIESGRIVIHPEHGPPVDVAPLREGDDFLYQLRGGHAGMIFQEPMTALSPVHTVGNHLDEAIRLHRDLPRAERRKLAASILTRVGLPGAEARLDRYPHELSGGMRQRVVIAIALVCEPRLLIADEPTTALDVTIQAQILELINQLRDELGIAVVLITHDLAVVSQTADDVVVMYMGRVVEQGPVDRVLSQPQHPYTQGLLASLPSATTGREARLPSIPGSVPSLKARPGGCAFHPRCRFAQPGRCDIGGPPPLRRTTLDDRVESACVRAEEIRGMSAQQAPREEQTTATASVRLTVSGNGDHPHPASKPPTDAPPLLRVRNLAKHFPVGKRGLIGGPRGVLKAVDDVSFDLPRGQTLGLVGESGCGKTTASRVIIRALAPTAGAVEFSPDPGAAVDLAALHPRDLKPWRTRVQMVFQDPFASLNPRMTVESIVGEPLRVHRLGKPRRRRDRVVDILEKVGLGADYLPRYPHEFSGGQRQRIGIARALVLRPALLIADEPVSALDVSVQAQVINLLSDLKREMGLTLIFVAHDLNVVRFISDRVAVMYAGRVVEIGDTDRIFAAPEHPYTRALIAASPDVGERRPPVRLEGEVPDPAHLPTGCAFHPRCPDRFDGCDHHRPDLIPRDHDHAVACRLYDGAEPLGHRRKE